MITRYIDFIKEGYDESEGYNEFRLSDYDCDYDSHTDSWDFMVTVNISSYSLSDFPVQFGKIKDDESKKIKNMCNFICSDNGLTTLKDGPTYVNGNFECDSNKLANLKFGPSYVGGNYKCGGNYITSLEGCPEKIFGNFSCSVNRLTTLENGPTEVDGNYIVSYNLLVTLKGCPEIIRGDFNCTNNKNLNTTEYFPKLIEGDVWLPDNLPIEEYPLGCKIKGKIGDTNPQFVKIFELIQENGKTLIPLMGDKTKFHQQIMRLDPLLIQFYTNIQRPSNKTII